MWAKPNKIPGKPIGIVQLPKDRHCPKCRLPYRRVVQIKTEDNKVSHECPHCGGKVTLWKIPPN